MGRTPIASAYFFCESDNKRILRQKKIREFIFANKKNTDINNETLFFYPYVPPSWWNSGKNYFPNNESNNIKDTLKKEFDIDDLSLSFYPCSGSSCCGHLMIYASSHEINDIEKYTDICQKFLGELLNQNLCDSFRLRYFNKEKNFLFINNWSSVIIANDFFAKLTILDCYQLLDYGLLSDFINKKNLYSDLGIRNYCSGQWNKIINSCQSDELFSQIIIEK